MKFKKGEMTWSQMTILVLAIALLFLLLVSIFWPFSDTLRSLAAKLADIFRL